MKNILIFITLISLLGSCSKFLEPKSQSEYVPKTADALNEMLLGEAYPSISGTEPMFAYHNIFDDDVQLVDTILYLSDLNNATRGLALRSLFSWSPDMYLYLSTSVNVWFSYYAAILGANAALDHIDQVSGSTEQKNYVRGQAYALRAFYYFQLVNLFGEPYTHNKQALGVPLKLTSRFVNIYPARNTVSEVYKQIVSDLIEAEKEYQSLPVEMQFKKNYRVSLPMIQHLRARVHLYMGEMETAAEYADKVIKDWAFSLYDLTKFKATDASPFPNYVTYANPETIWAFGKPDDSNKFVVSSGRMSNVPTETDTRIIFMASTSLLDCYGAGDFRRNLYMVDESTTNPTWTNKKCIGKTMITSSYNHDNQYFGLFFRLSEAYLTRAEAVSQTDPAEALRLINDLRKKRIKAADYKDIEGISGQQLLDSIYVERRRELCFEGHRWFDQRRQGMQSFSREWVENTSSGEVRKTYIMEKNDPAFTLQIMPEVMEENPSLKQNTLPGPK